MCIRDRSEGDAIDFGNLTQGRSHPGACNSSTRSLVAAGYGPNYRNEIDYVEIATIGNSVDFGDATNNVGGCAAMASPTRAVFAGGYGHPAFRNDIFYVEIMTTGNALDFGDQTVKRDRLSACSNGHGGL